jgi:hypothetical protein
MGAEEMFGEGTASSRHGTDRPAELRPSPSPSRPGGDRPPARPADETSVFEEGGMFGESTSTGRPADPAGESRHEQPDKGRPERNGVPPADQTWFMPPGDRPSN